jgi:hypothetical protein
VNASHASPLSRVQLTTAVPGAQKTLFSSSI